MTAREAHVLADGSEHEAAACPEGCPVRAGLERLLAGLESGSVRLVRQA